MKPRAAQQWLALSAILVVAALLRIWGLDQNGWGADYYSAAVRGMAQSGHNFLYAAFDPAGFISVDKPPLALWLQVVSVKLLGYRPLALLLPEALAGVAAVWLVHHLVRRTFGVTAGLVAALLLALMPIEVAVNRTNNTDSLLLLVLLLSAWPLLLAAETGRRRWLLLAMAGIGIAFNVKMLAAFIVLPAFAATYLAGDPARWRRRCVDLVFGGVVVAGLSLTWVGVVALTPSTDRPFVGGSGNDSIASLVLGHNARSRFMRPESASSTAGAVPTQPNGQPEQSASTQAAPPPRVEEVPAEDFGDDQNSSARTLARRLFVHGSTGPLRVFEGQMAAQFAWWLPLALLGIALGWHGPDRDGGDAARDGRRGRVIAIVFWTLWALTYVLVYGYLGGIVHFYYLSTLGPPLCALAGVGVAASGAGLMTRARGKYVLAAVVVVAAAWQLLVHARGLGWSPVALLASQPSWLTALHLAFAAFTLAAVVAFVVAAYARRRDAYVVVASTMATVALLALPTAWTLSSVLLPAHGIMPSADLYRLLVVSRTPESIELARLGQSPDTTRLVGYLQGQRNGERFLLATTTTRIAAPIIIATGEPVLARGGFHGLDAAVTPESMARMVGNGELRFAIVGDLTNANRALGAEAAAKPVTDWIRAHGRRVESSLWRGKGMGRGVQLYDLRPAAPA